MKKFILFILAFGYTLGYSQGDHLNDGDDQQVSADSASQIILPPLDSLFVWALENSASVKQQNALIDKSRADTRRVKKSILDAVKIGANIRTGNYGNPVINQVETGYSYGSYLSFSLYEVFSQKNLVDVYKAEEKVAEFKKAEVEFELKKIVTLLYNNVQTQIRILRIRNEAVNAAYVHLKMAEKEFGEGSVTVGELSRVTEIYTKTQTDREATMNDLKNYYMQLEQFCGRIF